MSSDIDVFDQELDTFIDSHMNEVIVDLQQLIKQPSVSARHEGLEECARLVCDIMRKGGINADVLYIEKYKSAETNPLPERNDSNTASVPSNNSKIYQKTVEQRPVFDSVPPIVYGEVRSRTNPQAKTLLFYNHYDVQPEEPVDLWDKAGPFSGKVDGNYIFGRGSSDDKGELITRIKAVEFYLRKTGDVPCNVKFIVEGEEEIGSNHIEEYISRYRQELACDCVIWEFGYINERGIPIVSLGMKGLLYVEMSCRTLSRDAHSSLATVLENPAWLLVRALNSIRDETGNILVKDWYKEVRQFTDQEEHLISAEPFDEQDFKNQYGIDRFLNDTKGVEARKALAGQPTCNLAGLVAGYPGDVFSNIVPEKATAKLDFRMVPDMNPRVQFNRLVHHLDEFGLKEVISTRFIHGERAARTDPNHYFVKYIQDSATEIFGNAVLSFSSAGTGPMYPFHEILKSPCISIGCTYVYSRIHSPNEFARLDLLNKAIKCITRVMKKASWQ